MTDYAAQITSVIKTAPSDLVSYYERGEFPVYPRSRINCLSFTRAKDYSQQVQGISVVKRLGLWILDDANDSNPYAYISSGPCAGMIIHFSHDPEPAIAFPSLSTFLQAMHNAGAQGMDIDDVGPEHMSVPLESEIRALAEEDMSDDRTFLLTTYLPVCAELGSETKGILARDTDFFVREALAAYLTQRPRLEDLALAEQLSRDRHSQVARQASAAAAAIKHVVQAGPRH